MSGHCGPDLAVQGVSESWPNSLRGGEYTASPAVGSRRGVVVFPAGMSGVVAPQPPGAPQNTGGVLPSNNASLISGLSGSPHNWVVKSMPQSVGYGFGTVPPNQQVINDLANDPANTGTFSGPRFMGNLTRWLAHYIDAIEADYPNFPICFIGFSWGAWTSLQVGLQFNSSVVAFGAHHPPLLMNHINTTFLNLSGYSSTALDLGSTALNGVPSSMPIYLGWGTADTVVDEPDGGDILTPALATAATTAGKTITTNGRATNHVMDSTDVTAIESWFSSWESAYPATL